MKNTLLFCNGVSGSGKSHFVQNVLPTGLFYNLRSATTRPMRTGESEGNPYFFRDEAYFDNTPLATRLWVNEDFWTPNTPKWLYGVPESEILQNLGKNLIYDVIEPKYTQQMIQWFKKQDLARFYNFKVAYFLPDTNNADIVAQRTNMPHDTSVRQANTCNPIDFFNAGIDIDYILQPVKDRYNSRLNAHIARLLREQHKTL